MSPLVLKEDLCDAHLSTTTWIHALILNGQCEITTIVLVKLNNLSRVMQPVNGRAEIKLGGIYASFFTPKHSTLIPEKKKKENSTLDPGS